MWGLSALIAANLRTWAGPEALGGLALAVAAFLIAFGAWSLWAPFRVLPAPDRPTLAETVRRPLTNAGIWFDILLICPIFAAALAPGTAPLWPFVLGAALGAWASYGAVARPGLAAHPQFWPAMRLTMGLVTLIAVAMMLAAGFR